MKKNDDMELDTNDIDDSVVTEEHQSDTIKKLKEKLKEAEGKAKEHLNNWQRAQADFINIRKRDEEAKSEFIKFAHTNTLAELIPVLDSFNIALSHGQKEVEPIYTQFLGILRGAGLEESNPVGETFDPRLHEAIGTIETKSEKEDHKVLEVLQKGYILNGKVLRPAKVKIGDLAKG
ncbi:MAG: nucleotide exchange factor GrpE [Parcubacteria group bacterium]